MWIALSMAWGACGPDLETDIAAAERDDTLEEASVDAMLACHAEPPLDPAMAARVHHLYARVIADPTRAAQHLYSAWEADPPRPPPEGVSDEVLAKLMAMQEATRPPVQASPAAFLRIDGSPSTWVRAGQPYLTQGPGRPSVLVDASAPFVPPATAEKKPSGWLIAGISSGVIAAGLYGGAWASRDRYQELVATNGPNELRQSAHDTTNVLSVGSVVGAVAGAGLLTVHIVR